MVTGLQKNNRTYEASREQLARLLGSRYRGDKRLYEARYRGNSRGNGPCLEIILLQ